MSRIITVITCALVAALTGLASGEQTHPFLICTEDGKDPNFVTLQARASDPNSPWGIMKDKASKDYLLIDDVRIYEAGLDSNDIGLIYNGTHLTDDLVAYWKMDDDPNDWSDPDLNGNGLPSANPPGFIEDVPDNISGISEYALNLLNTEDRVVIPNYKCIGGDTSRTVSMWIKTGIEDVTDLITWGYSKATGGGGFWMVRILPVDDKVVLLLQVGGRNIIGSTNLADNNWHHIAVVLPEDEDDIEDVILYVDDAEEDSTDPVPLTINTDTSGNASDLVIGSSVRHLNGEFNPVAAPTRAFFNIQRKVSKAALCYILYEDPNYADIVRREIEYLCDLNGELIDWIGVNGNVGLVPQHGSYVAPGSALFQSILALDIINEGFEGDPNTLEDLEGLIFGLVTENTFVVDSWPMNKAGFFGLWALYNSDLPGLIKWKYNEIRSYDRRLQEYVTASGVCEEGPGYSWARFSGFRDAKAYFMDVLEFTKDFWETGSDDDLDDYYENTRLQGFYEWLYGYSLTPFNQYLTFGDTSATQEIGSYVRMEALLRADRFTPVGSLTANYAAYLMKDAEPRVGLLSYIFMPENGLPTPIRPTASKVFETGGAFFRENISSDQALYGALWNTDQVSQWGHDHLETNAIQLSAYGVKVTQNGGYPRPVVEQEWAEYEAESASVVLVDGENHSFQEPDGYPGSGEVEYRHHGDGIIEHFTNPAFDYACGYSGDEDPDPPEFRGALGPHKHYRNFVFVHPQDGENGYWILFDEVDADEYADEDEDVANVVLHPFSGEEPTYIEDLSYEWEIHDSDNKYIKIFLGTTPSDVDIIGGEDDYPMGVIAPPTLKGRYLYSTYDTDANGQVNIVTVLFPYDDDHAVADMSRIETTDYSGAKIDHGDSIVDYALESDGTSGVVYGDVDFTATAVYWRMFGDLPLSYFARAGMEWTHDPEDDDIDVVGFEVDALDSDVSIYMRDGIGKVITNGSDTDITFYQPGLYSVTIREPNDAFVTSATNSTEDIGDELAIQIGSAGTYKVELVIYPVRNVTPDPDVWYDSIQAAIDDADAGEEIEAFYPGTYNELVDFDGCAITLSSIDPDNPDVVAATIIDGDGLETNYGQVTFSSGEDANSVLSGFTIMRSDNCGVYISSSSTPVVSNCIIKNNDNPGVEVNIAGGFIDNCIIKDNGFRGISCTNSSAVIANCTLSGHYGAGVGSDGASPPDIRNSLIYENLVGIWIEDATSAARIQNNTLADNTIYGIGTEDVTASPVITNCILWNNGYDELYDCSATYSCIEGATEENGNINSDPDFVDDANDDYHLLSTSPCIDVGDPDGTYTGQTDIDGDDRVIDIAGKGDGDVDVDMGADEYDT